MISDISSIRVSSTAVVTVTVTTAAEARASSKGSSQTKLFCWVNIFFSISIEFVKEEKKGKEKNKKNYFVNRFRKIVMRIRLLYLP